MNRQVRKMIRLSGLMIVILVLGVAMGGAADAGAADTEGAPLERITLVAPPGPLAIPMVYLVVNNRLSAIAEEIDFSLWKNPGQLRAIVAGNQADFLTLPSNAAAMFYNKGLGVQLLDISVWNILSVISSDDTIASFSELVGKGIVIPFQGSMPDLLFRYIAQQQGLDPAVDFELQYAANPRLAAQLLLKGRVQHAVLPEPLATIVMLQTRGTERPLHRAVQFETELDALGVRAAIAGTVALAAIQERPDLIDIFLAEYALAVAWVIANPDEAGRMAEEHLPELGFKAGPVAQSLRYIDWEFVPAGEARPYIDAFFTELMTLSPYVVGGALPGDGFFYQVEQ
ncbi:ABC transporter substrate-binding protein [Candidatus Bipolaricaulota bacterium]|nr:ABC transporter substrate-binding protein [Candidatus Bipolaricaulota bacterium]